MELQINYKRAIYGFSRFSSSLKCRLRHYKDFKERIFNTDFPPRTFALDLFKIDLDLFTIDS